MRIVKDIKTFERKKLLRGFDYSVYASEIDSYVNPIFKSSFWQWSQNPPDQGIFKSPAVIFSDTANFSITDDLNFSPNVRKVVAIQKRLVVNA